MQKKSIQNGSYSEHQKIVHDCLIMIGVEFPSLIRLWKNNVGIATIKNSVIAYGIKDAPDLIGFINNGKWIGVEVKSGNATQSPGQINFEIISNKFNAIYVLVRSADDLRKFLQSL